MVSIGRDRQETSVKRATVFSEQKKRWKINEKVYERELSLKDYSIEILVLFSLERMIQ